MPLIKNIKSQDWALSLALEGDIVEGVNDINQCIHIILKTEKGSDPLRPEFGVAIFNYIDKPVSIIPSFVKEMADAIAIWETRITVKKISYEILVGQVTFYIQWYLNNPTENNSPVIITYDIFK